MQDEKKPEGAQGTGEADAGKKSESNHGKSFSGEEAAALLKENMAFKKKLQEIESAQAAAEKKALLDQGKFKELHEAEVKRVAALALQLKRAKFHNLALAKGITSDKIINRIDISGIEMDDSGSLIGADEIISDLLAMGGHSQQPEQPKGRPATPAGKSSIGGPASFDDWQKMPPEQRNDWALKNPDQFKSLCDRAKQR